MNYRFPLKTWIIDVLKERQANINKSNLKMPFIIMSSAAKIVQSKPGMSKEEIMKQVGEILTKPDSKPKYKGCIITNHTDPKINYNIGKTIVGYDFDGNIIECESESGRKISPVIIESLDIKADGTAMTRKIAMVNIRCFSLHQLELVEQFFLQMGMHVLIEFGDNSYINEITNNNLLATKSDYDKFRKDFLKYQIPTGTEFAEYLNDCRKSKGSYDRFAGILFDYNYKINIDGTFSVMATYIQGNEINYQMPLTINTGFGVLRIQKEEEPTLFQEIMYNIANDMPGMDLEALLKLNENDWKNEFFNFTKINNSTEDVVVSSTPYISLKFILTQILNNLLTKGSTNPDFKLNLPNSGNTKIFKIGGGKYDEIVPIKIHKFITAQDGAVLFPNKSFPKYGVTEKGILTTDTKNLVDASINGKSIIVNEEVEFQHPSGNEKINLKDPYVIGNALNIFIDYNRVITAWYQSYSRIDFLEQILELINDRSFGIFKLGYGNLYENSSATIIDFKLFSELNKTPTEKDPARLDYRFNPLSINSIVRDFDFTFNMDSNAAAIAIQNANAFVAQNRFGTDSVAPSSIEFRDRIYGLSSYSNHTTVDGLYSINQIQYDKLLPPTGSFSKYESNDDNSTPYDVDYTTSESDNLINFKLNPNDKKSIQTLVVTNTNYLYTKLINDKSYFNTDTQVLTNISINFKLDGLSGFNIGETFTTDGVPEMRNKIGEFRINNIQHTMDNQNGWLTTIEADWVYKYKS
jgi:hypothetical protein